MESIKIAKLEIENVKRVHAVKIEPTKAGLTIIGGDNGHGKTSILDAISWALGGNKFRPKDPKNSDSVIPLVIDITLSNGLRVERRGKNSDLKVTDPSGQKAGQALLDSFVEEFALDLPRFMSQTSKEKAQTLLRILGVEDQLLKYEQEEKEVYNKRHAIGQIADQKKKYAKEMDYYPDAPKDPILATEIIQKQQAILLKNEKNKEYRNTLASLERQESELISTIKDLEEELIRKKSKLIAVTEAVKAGKKTAAELKDESTAELEESLKNIEAINLRVRKNLEKDKAEEDAAEYEQEYNNLSIKLNDIRNSKANLLENADLPLPELSVKDGELTYRGHTWTDMSGSEQLKVATAIVRKLNPNCGFVIMDKLEQMDLTTLNEFGRWLEIEGLQAIATRVSKGDECQIIIEDGYAIKNETLTNDPEEIATIKPVFQPGMF